MRRLVILRPEPGASMTLARAEAAGIDAVAIPLFAVGTLAWTAPDPADFDALLLTSANAVRHAGPQLAALSSLPAYCVGAATAAAAEQAGLALAGTGTGDVAKLTRHIPAGLRLLHLTGANHRAIPGTVEIAVYDSMAIDPPPALEALDGGVAMIHSPRAGGRLAELVTDRDTITVAAISPAAATACGDGWAEVRAIDAPADGALLALAADLCHKPGR